MRILGLVETSLVDWDGKISAVVFLGGCNFHCPFCHNGPVARDDRSLPEVKWAEVAALLERKLGWLDGVVVTGGEPMMHPEVFDLCRRIRKLGLQVKVDTNGSFPYPLKRLIALGLVDFVAMDVKAPLDRRYGAAAGRSIDPVVMQRAIRLLMESKVDYEFRCTVVPGLVGPEDIPAIGESLRGAKLVVLQQYVPDNAAAEGYRAKKPYARADGEAMLAQLKPFVKEARLRGKFF